MKSPETKESFITLRAQQKTYTFITKELQISMDTCRRWESELKGEIDKRKSLELERMYEQYGMSRKGKIKRLGETLTKLDEALLKSDLTKMPPEKILDFRLKYMEALDKEYNPVTPEENAGKDYSDVIEKVSVVTIKQLLGTMDKLESDDFLARAGVKTEKELYALGTEELIKLLDRENDRHDNRGQVLTKENYYESKH